MSLYGALYAGVSGIRAQGSKIGIISDNIANVNTVGYKQGQAQFETLVTNTGATSSYSPGGVIGSNRQLVDKQGLIQSTDAPTDIAISGKGFYAVNAAPDGSGEPLYTRAGSFRQDNLGNFLNASGFYLQGWPLDRDGRLPGQPGNLNTISNANLDSLETVNVQAASGAAAATTSIAIGANLKASEKVYLGAGGIADLGLASTSINNQGLSADDILVSNQFGGAALNGIVKGDSFKVTTGKGQNYSFEYGGFTTGRNITAAVATNAGEGANNIAATAVNNNGIATTTGSNVITVTSTAHGFATGQVISLNNIGALGANTTITPAMLNGPHQITVVNANTYTFTTTANADATEAATGGAAMTNAHRSYNFNGNMFDANVEGGVFLSSAGILPFSNAALSFTITTTTGGTKTFTYANSSPNAQAGQFNSLTTLASAIDAAQGLTARVVDGRLLVGSENGTDAVTFNNLDDVGTGGLAGIDWVRELDLSNIAVSATPRFSTLQALAAQVNAYTDLKATISNPLSNASLSLNVADPQDTIRISGVAGNTGNLIKELGFDIADPSEWAVAGVPDTGQLEAKYNPSLSESSMSSGAITAQFSRPIRIYDAQGTGHDVRMSFIKIDANKWAMEVHVIPPEDIVPPGADFPDGQIARGIVEFNGDGTLRSVSSSLVTPLNINWTNGAAPSTIALNLGTAGAPAGSGATVIGDDDGLAQLDGNYKAGIVDQNGAPVGELTGVTIDEDGFVVASYSNGETQRVYKLPLADFSNPNGLRAITGNVYAQTRESGEVNLREAGEDGTGKIRASSLESSNVELADQLTDMIVAQRAYQANTRVIKTSDELLEQLNQL